jgi:hypothetical protein
MLIQNGLIDQIIWEQQEIVNNLYLTGANL